MPPLDSSQPWCRSTDRSPSDSARWLLLAGLLLALSGCGLPQGNPRSQLSGTAEQGATPVDVAIATPGELQQLREYTGTTQPIQEVSLRSQVEGQLLRLDVNVGDRVEAGQTVAQVHAAILEAAVVQAQAELTSRQAEVSRLETQVSDARTQVEEARLRLQQAERDADRLGHLASQGAIARQQAEQARTNANAAAQVLRSAEEQVASQQKEVTAAESRITAQQAVIAQAEERRSFTEVKAPIAGFVLAKTSEAGNLVQPGTEILKIGDFSRSKVVVQVSELELTNLRVGQSVQVRLDAVPNQRFTGTIARITPAANPTSRLLPIEIVVPNPTGQNGSGLLARVTFESDARRNIVVPVSALQGDRTRGRGASLPGANFADRASGETASSPGAKAAGRSRGSSAPANWKTSGTLFVVSGSGEQATVAARSVTLGAQLDGRVEILAGLRPGERFISRSGRPLQDGDAVRLSILSEK